MIDARIRRDVLGTFPAGTPCLILAPERAGFAELVRERNDPAMRIATLDALAADESATPHVVLEGIDDLDDPRAYLVALRTAVPDARLFALVAHAGHLTALGAFFAGRSPARAHPLSAAELPPLFENAGWKALSIKPIRDPAVPDAASAPCMVTAGPIGFRCFDRATLERGGVAAFLVIADPA